MSREAERRWQHPWLRIQLLLRAMLGTRWDAVAWPTIRAELRRVLRVRGEIQRMGWFN